MPVIKARLRALISAPWAASPRRSSRAAVAVFEPYDVVELGRGHLDHLALLERFHAVAQSGRDVRAIAGREHLAVRRCAVGRGLEPEAPGEHADRLVLDPMVLQAQRLTLANVENLA